MKYVIADRSKVLSYGINAIGHRSKEAQIFVNEKELDVVPGDTLNKRAKAVDGRVYTATGIKRIINEGGWL